MLPTQPYVDTIACAERIGMGGEQAKEWLAQNGPDNLGAFDCRDFLYLAARVPVFPVKTRMGVWQSIIERWLGHAWGIGEHALALSLVHSAMTGITQQTALAAWPRVLNSLDVHGQRAMGAYLKQIDGKYWAGKPIAIAHKWEENLVAMKVPSAFIWVTPAMIEAWSEEDVLAVACSRRSGSLGVGAMTAWLSEGSTADLRLCAVQEAMRAPGRTADERTALIVRLAPALMSATQEQQASFYADLSGPEVLTALAALTRSKYVNIDLTPFATQVRCLAVIYNRLGSAPCEVKSSAETQQRLGYDLGRPVIWAAITPAALRNLVLLRVAMGIASDEGREWCREKLREVGLSPSLLDIVTTLGLRSWPEVVTLSQPENVSIALPEMGFD